MGRFTIHFGSFTFDFTQVKVKNVGMPHKSELYIKNAIVKLALL